MNCIEIKTNHARYFELLLIGDENQAHLETYLYSGRLFILENESEQIGAMILQEKNNGIELENLSILPEFQKQGFGSALLRFACENSRGKWLILGTDDVSGNVDFYQKNGFEIFKTEKNYFIEAYDSPCFENGIQLKDKIFLRKYCK